MKLPFLDRDRELERLNRLLRRDSAGFGVLYGRRRCGKSRLLREALSPDRSIFFVGDDRDGALQQAGLAREAGRLLDGFDQVRYPDWDALLARLWREAPEGLVLVLDELPAMVAAVPELPSLLQKQVDRHGTGAPHLLLAGSSQRMMQGLVLDRTAPLFGRATEILEIRPLGAGWIAEALGIEDPVAAVEAFAHWGGVPRYWELAADHPDLRTAVRDLLIDPFGVLRDEPRWLLLDDLRDTTQASSILSLIGQGCHRVSEIAGRLGKPATSLGRPLQRLMEMGLVAREVPFGSPPRGSKRTLYRIADPFLRYWFGYVEPNRSRSEAGMLAAVEADIAARVSHHVAGVWEDLARESVPHLDVVGGGWGPAGRWWGAGVDRRPLEVDLVAESADGRRVLVGEVKWSAPDGGGRLLREVEEKAARLPLAADREVATALWLKSAPRDLDAARVVTPDRVLRCLR